MQCLWIITLVTLLAGTACGYERYSDCAGCHQSFKNGYSPQGTVFPKSDKHEMHRSSSYMNTDCKLCHRSDDDNNPFIGSSDGIGGVPGLGCTGCHEAAGLRQHHLNTGTVDCLECHGAEQAPPEGTNPPYYGTAYTRANNATNSVMLSNTNENWSVGDFLGLDNDGDNLYDVADYDCGPFRITGVVREGNNMRVTWQTAGGRTNQVQAASAVKGTYTNLGSSIKIPGVGILTTNFLEVGGATNSSRRFYRLKSAP